MIKIENLGTEFDEVTAGFHHEEIYVGLVDEMLNITEPIEIKKLKPVNTKPTSNKVFTRVPVCPLGSSKAEMLEIAKSKCFIKS